MSAPVLGAQGSPYVSAGSWQASVGFRHQRSDTHFVGDVRQDQRETEGSEVINRVELLDINVRYAASDRIELSLGVPYLIATRSSAIRNASRQVIGRYTTQARGIGDIVFSARRWMLDPHTCKTHNISLGLGLKLPTGTDNATDTFQSFSNGTITTSIQTVDQSIQPGYGGFGGGVASSRSRCWETAAPRSTSGASAAIPWVRGTSAGFGVRWEGVPVHDLIGSSAGFRRPGYAVSLEPSLSWAHGASSVYLSVPFAVYRNRLISVPGVADGTHGDAAFAKYVVLLGYSHGF